MAPAKKKADGVTKETADTSVESKSDASNLLESIFGNSDLKEVVGRRSDITRRSLFQKKDGEALEDLKNDDEKEKEERRKEEAEKAKTSKAVTTNFISNMTPQELEEHYTKCIRMCNQNKVNPKNAFKLQLIDYMKTITMNRDKKTENLSLMSYALDASVKIYACRVDKVYQDMLDALATKDWSKKLKESDDEDDEKDSKTGDENDDEEAALKQRRVHHSDSEDDKDISYDCTKMIGKPQQFKKSRLEKDYCGISLPHNQEYFLESRPCAPNGTLSIMSYLLFVAENSSVTENSIDLGPSHQGSNEGARITDFVPEYKSIFRKYLSDETYLSKSVETSLTIDPTASLNPDLLMNDMDSSGLNCSAVDPGDHCYDYDDEVIAPQAPSFKCPDNKINNIVPVSFSVPAMSKMVTAASNDYTYFDESKINFFAGPSHWRLKASKNKEVRNNEAKPSKKTFNVNFTVEQAQANTALFNDTVDAKLARKTMCTWSKSKCTYPPFVNFEQRHILRLFKNKAISYMKRSGSTVTEGEDIEEKYNTDEMMKPDDFQAAHDDDHVGDDNDSDVEPPPDNADVTNALPSNVTVSQENTDGDNNYDGMSLLPAPPKLNRIEMTFAKFQKKIDVKLLKQTIWGILGLESDPKEKPLPTDVGSSDHIKASAKLSDVFKELPRKLPPQEVDELSFPIAFMALLHMANEKSLVLKGNESYSDVEIFLG